MLKEIKERRSCKKFKSEMPSDEQISEIVNAGICAPSGKNTQNGIVVVIKNKKLRDSLASLNAKIAGFKEGFDPFYNAPVVLLVLMKKYPNGVYDGSCMMENMLIEAENQGLGACWIHRAKEEIASEEGKSLLKCLNLNLDDYEGIAHAVIGYRDGLPIPKEIKPNRVIYLN